MVLPFWGYFLNLLNQLKTCILPPAYVCQHIHFSIPWLARSPKPHPLFYKVTNLNTLTWSHWLINAVDCGNFKEHISPMYTLTHCNLHNKGWWVAPIGVERSYISSVYPSSTPLAVNRPVWKWCYQRGKICCWGNPRITESVFGDYEVRGDGGLLVKMTKPI